MTLAEFLTDPDAWLGREVVIEGGWLHCDSSLGVFLDAGPVFEKRQVLIRSLWVGKWIRNHIAPRPGAPTPYMFPASVRGTVQPRQVGRPPVLAGELYITLQYEGQLHLRGPSNAPPIRVPDSRSGGTTSSHAEAGRGRRGHVGFP